MYDIVLKVDSHFKSVELSGLGFKLWREERFPQIAKSLFKRIMQDLDSQAESSSKFELTTEDISYRAHIERNSQEKLDREPLTTNNGTDVKDRANVNVAPFNASDFAIRTTLSMKREIIKSHRNMPRHMWTWTADLMLMAKQVH